MANLTPTSIHELHETERGPQHGAQRRWIIWLLTGLMVVFTLIKLPDGLHDLIGLAQPIWLLLVLLYWSIAIPRSVGLLLPWLAGLIIDVSTNAPLGQHALALTTTVFLAQKGYLQLRNLGNVMQLIVIIVLLTFYQLQLLWIDMLISRDNLSIWRGLPILTTTMLWPLAFILQRALRHQWRIR